MYIIYTFNDDKGLLTTSMKFVWRNFGWSVSPGRIPPPSSSSEKVEMRRRQSQPSVVLVWCTLLGGVSSQPSQCCPSISVTSSSVGEEYQAVQLGLYSIKDNLTVNGRPVYKQVRGDQYFYYWVSSDY